MCTYKYIYVIYLDHMIYISQWLQLWHTFVDASLVLSGQINAAAQKQTAPKDYDAFHANAMVEWGKLTVKEMKKAAKETSLVKAEDGEELDGKDKKTLTKYIADLVTKQEKQKDASLGKDVDSALDMLM